MLGYVGYGAASALLGAVLYANLPTKYTIGAVVPTAKFLAEARLKKISNEKDLLTAKETKVHRIVIPPPVTLAGLRALRARPGARHGGEAARMHAV